jgi:CRP-like cAMP-binding protein
MASQSKLEKLRSSAFFQEFPPECFEQLVDIGREIELPARTTVFKEYDRAKDVYVILSGEISLAICEKEDSCRLIGTLRQGDLMGWSALVGRPRLYDTARTVTDVTALALDAQKLMEFCAANPKFGFKFMHRIACVLAERLSGTRLQLLELSGVHLPKFQLESD